MPGVPPTKEGVKALFTMFHAAFPDFRAEIHDMLVDGDKVVTYKTFHGTHEGDLMGVAGTGNKVEIPVMDIVRFRDGQVVEHWNVVDQLPLLQALDVIPS
jgi:predicted ester cyclase